MSTFYRRLISKKIIRLLQNKSSLNVPGKGLVQTLNQSIKLKRISKKTSISDPQFQVILKGLNSSLTPQQLKCISASLPTDFDVQEDDQVNIDKIEVEKDRVNFHFHTEDIIRNTLSTILKDGDNYGYKGDLTHDASENILVEYSSPNIAKPFHAGHLRSAIIGNFIANLYQAVGHKVFRINYLGDWGTQFGLLLYGYQKYGDDNLLHQDPMHHLFEVYVKVNKDVEAEQKDDMDVSGTYEEGLEMFRKLEKGDEKSLELWKKFRDLSIREYKKLYKRLNIEFTEYEGESMYYSHTDDLLDSLDADYLLKVDRDRGVHYVEVDTAGKLNKAVLLKSDGTSLYLTRDIIAAMDRHMRYDITKSHYVVDHSQILHFQHLVGVLKRLGLPWAVNYPDDVHIKFGRIEGMSSRKGQVVFLEDILNEARDRMIEVMKSKDSTKEVENIEEVADILGISGIIVQDLKARRMQNYEFSWDKVINFKADSGVFLQYAHARLCSLLQNSEDVQLHDNVQYQCLSELSAYHLILHLAGYVDAVEESFVTMEPHKVVQYLFSLGHFINAAHRDLHVKGQPCDVAEARLLMFHCAKVTLSNGLRLLGLTPLEKM